MKSKAWQLDILQVWVEEKRYYPLPFNEYNR
jgi:hypothetical protein